jgi:hypothetical protein
VDIKAFNKKRIILAIASTPGLFCLITYPWRLHVFGEYQSKVLAACIALAYLVWVISGPTVEEVQEAHDQMIKADREAYEADNDYK